MTPSYANSPVSEVVFGVHFEPVVGLLSPHYGLLWETFREHGFEKLQELPPVPPSPRPMDAGQTPAPALSRIWFVREDDQQLVQVQRDRLIFNWRKTAANERYPGFAVVFATFVGHLRRFQTFLRAFELGDVEPLEFELSYVNHVLPSEVWSELSDVRNVFPDFGFGGSQEMLEVHWRTMLRLEGVPGIVNTTVRSARRNPDNQPLLLLELSAKGLSGEPELYQAVDHWFDAAHESLGTIFEQMTSDAIRARWR